MTATHAIMGGILAIIIGLHLAWPKNDVDPPRWLFGLGAILMFAGYGSIISGAIMVVVEIVKAVKILW